MRRSRAFAALLTAALAAPSAGGAFLSEPPAEARLLAGWEAGPGARVAGLEIAMAPGWKTYWRSPGEAGIPPRFDWSGSENVASVAVEWPAPELFDSFGFATLGYGGRVVLPLRVAFEDADAPARLALTLDYGLCEEICIPVRAELALDLAPGAAEAERGAIAAARAARPASAAEAGVTRAACAVTGAGDARIVSAEIGFARAPAAAPYVVLEGPEGVWVGAAERRLEGDVLRATAELATGGSGGWLARDAFDVTLIGEGWAASLPGCGAGEG